MCFSRNCHLVDVDVPSFNGGVDEDEGDVVAVVLVDFGHHRLEQNSLLQLLNNSEIPIVSLKSFPIKKFKSFVKTKHY
jgi:hypothetical protein